MPARFSGFGYPPLMFGMGMGELLLILVVALIVVGPDKLPGAARAIGKGIRDLRRHTHDLQATLEQDEKLGDAVRELRSALHEPVRTLRAPFPPPRPPGAPPPGPAPLAPVSETTEPSSTLPPSPDGTRAKGNGPGHG